VFITAFTRANDRDAQKSSLNLAKFFTARTVFVAFSRGDYNEPVEHDIAKTRS